MTFSTFTRSKFKCLIFLTLCLFAYGSKDFDNDKANLLEFGNAIENKKNIAVLFTRKCCTCTECVEAEALLSAIQPSLDAEDVIFAKFVEQVDLEKQYGVKRHPSLIFLRDGIPALYNGPFDEDSVIQWLSFNKEPLVKPLDENTFEHLTQASTGSTTGDWLISFYRPSCISYMEHISILEGLATELKQKLNVAVVDMSTSPQLQERFKIKKCPSIWFFRPGKMYEYDLPNLTIDFLKMFVEKLYKEYKGHPIPHPLTYFDKLTDNIVLILKENPSYKYAVAPLIIFIFLIYFFVTKKVSKDDKKEK